jgi:hypothetical protein
MIRKLITLMLVAAILSLSLAAPVYAGRGGSHSGHHGGFHHGGCCWGGAFFGGLLLGSVIAAPYYPYPYYADPYPYAAYPGPVYAPAPAYQTQTQVYVAPAVQREACYATGCYHLQGDGVTTAYQWVWVPAAPAPPSPPPGPPSR